MKTQEVMNFGAREIGTFIPSTSWEGRIHSVFSKAVNILHPEGVIVSLVEEPYQMSSLSILVPEYFQRWREGECNGCERLRDGTRVFCSPEKLGMGDFSFDLRRGRLWKGLLSIEGFHFQKISLFKKALLSLGKSSGIAGILRDEKNPNLFLRKFRQVLENTKCPNLKNNEVTLSGLSSLVGLGIGLTPSGDDFITGALLGERMLSLLLMFDLQKVKEETGKSFFLRVEKDEISTNLSRTTSAGRTLLWQALRRQFPAFLLRLANQIANSSSFDEITDGLAEACRHGETSGMDASIGLYWFLNYFKRLDVSNNCDRRRRS